MYGTIAVYNGSATAGAENALNAVADPDFTIQSNNFVFTSDYLLLGAALVGASVQYGRYNTAQWAIQGYPRIYAANRGATPPSQPLWDKNLNKSVHLPQDQAFQIYATNNLGASTEAEFGLLQLGSPGWNMNYQPGMWDVILRATATITPTVGTWNENNAIAFDQSPLGGVYVVNGTVVEGGNAVAYRWNFPRAPNYAGRRMRPGGIVTTTWGNLPAYGATDAFHHWGQQGAFWTYEQPTLGILGVTASSTTYNIFMHCTFIGQDSNLLDRYVGSQT